MRMGTTHAGSRWPGLVPPARARTTRYVGKDIGSATNREDGCQASCTLPGTVCSTGFMHPAASCTLPDLTSPRECLLHLASWAGSWKEASRSSPLPPTPAHRGRLERNIYIADGRFLHPSQCHRRIVEGSDGEYCYCKPWGLQHGWKLLHYAGQDMVQQGHAVP